MSRSKKQPLPWERQPGETESAFSRFQMYMEMAIPRRLAPIARMCSVSDQMIGQLSMKHKWRDRVAAFDAHIWQAKCNEVVRQHEEVTKEQMNTIRIGRRLLSERIHRLARKSVEEPEILDSLAVSDTYRDLERFVKLERLMFGDATERVERRMVSEQSSSEIDFSTLSTEEVEALQTVLPVLQKIGLIVDDDADLED